MFNLKIFMWFYLFYSCAKMMFWWDKSHSLTLAAIISTLQTHWLQGQEEDHWEEKIAHKKQIMSDLKDEKSIPANREFDAWGHRIISVSPYPFVVSPSITRARLAQVKDFIPLDSDVFIVTPPKCGTTWTQQIVRYIRACYFNVQDDLKVCNPKQPSFT